MTPEPTRQGASGATRATGEGRTEMDRLRQIDALVAEHVMGLKLRAPDEMEYTQDREWADGETFVIDNGLANAELVPKYSSNIAAAWRVVEKLQADGRLIDLGWAPEVGPWGFAIKHTDWSGPVPIERSSHCELADSAPLAICLAALKAAGVEPPREQAEVEPVVHCGKCGALKQIVRPGKWQCPECE